MPPRTGIPGAATRFAGNRRLFRIVAGPRYRGGGIDRTKIGEHLTQTRVAFLRVPIEAIRDGEFQVLGHITSEFAHRLQFLGQDGKHDRGRVVAFDGTGPGHHFIENRAHRPDIRSGIDIAAGGLLGRHICRRAHRGPGLGQVGDIAQLGETKIEDLDPAGRQDDVCRFDIAVDDSSIVRRGQAFGDLNGDGSRLLEGDRTAEDPLFDGLAGAIGHRDKRLSVVGFADLEHGADSRAIERRGGFRLAQKALAHLRVLAEIGGQEFEGHNAVEFLIPRPVHNPHASPT